jgi:hypothetical protein
MMRKIMIALTVVSAVSGGTTNALARGGGGFPYETQSFSPVWRQVRAPTLSAAARPNPYDLSSKKFFNADDLKS